VNWFGSLLIGYWAANALTTILIVGRRFTYTPVVVATIVSINTGFIWGLLAVGTGT